MLTDCIVLCVEFVRHNDILCPVYLFKEDLTECPKDWPITFAAVKYIILQGNKNLDGVSHIIVDEVHERSLLVSFLSLHDMCL